MRAVALCVLVFVALANAEDEKICEPGTHFMNECNSCICSEDGTDAECSRMLCLGASPRTKRTTFPICQPGWTSTKNGATCTCNAEGTSLHCTTKRSPSVISQPSDDSANHHGLLMENPFFRHVKLQGTIRKTLDCSQCSCIPDGSGISYTRRLCAGADKVGVRAIPGLRDTILSSQSRERRQSLSGDDDQECVPNSRFKSDCNWCTCSSDGRYSLCTQMGCLGPNPALLKPRERRQVLSEGDDFRCVPNSRFQQDCNWCTCLPDGRGAGCTEIGCLGLQQYKKNNSP